MNDVMDRLQAANPVREAPPLPPVEPLLSRLDDAPVKRRRRRPLWVLAPALAAVVAVFVGLELRGGTDVIAEAREALGSGTNGIVHIKLREEIFNPDGTLVAGSGTTPEIWSAREPLRFRTRQQTRAGASYDAAYANCTTSAENPKTGKVATEKLNAATCKAMEDIDRNSSVMQPGRDPIPVIRRLLAGGQLEHEGSTEVDGRKVERLVAWTPAGNDGTPAERIEYLVDAKTFAPVRIQTKGTTKDGRPAGSQRYTFLTYQELPLNAKSEKLLVLQ